VQFPALSTEALGTMCVQVILDQKIHGFPLGAIVGHLSQRWLGSCNASPLMLPSSKRHPRNQEPVETISTGDYEVVHAAPPSSRRPSPSQYPSPPSDRPRVFERSASDEEKTLFFATHSSRGFIPPRANPGATVPPIPKAPRAPEMNVRALVRQTRPVDRHEAPSMRGAVRPRLDAEDRTVLRPTALVPSPSANVAAPPSRPSSRAPAAMPTPFGSVRPAAAVATPAANAPASVGARKPTVSDSQAFTLDPPAAANITQRTRAVRARANVSWAAALLALGVFVGLVTAVVARGDADALIDATASFVDPAHTSGARANAAAAQAAVLPSFIDTSHGAPMTADAKLASGACVTTGSDVNVSTPIVVNSPPPGAKVASGGASVDPTAAARPAPPRPAPVAYAAPRWTPKAAPAAAPPSTGGGSLANITPSGAGQPIARPSRASKGDFESAAAADALAKAQLEASLR
jgi:hypothetical protein